MFDRAEYKGMVSQGFDYHHGNITIEHLYSKEDDFIKLSLDYGYAMRKFFYDMQYIKDFKEEFEDESLNKIMDLKKRDLCLDLEKKWTDIGQESVFSTDLGVAKLYEEPLKEFFDDTSFITFSKEYYLKEGFGFSSLNKTPDIDKQPSDKKYFKALYATHKNNSMLKSLEEVVGANEEILNESPNLESIYYVDSKNKNYPKIYELEMETTLFQMKYLNGRYGISNIYFQFDGMLLQYIEGEYGKWNITYSSISENYIKDGLWFMPYIGNSNELIELKDK